MFNVMLIHKDRVHLSMGLSVVPIPEELLHAQVEVAHFAEFPSQYSG